MTTDCGIIALDSCLGYERVTDFGMSQCPLGAQVRHVLPDSLSLCPDPDLPFQIPVRSKYSADIQDFNFTGDDLENGARSGWTKDGEREIRSLFLGILLGGCTSPVDSLSTTWLRTKPRRDSSI